MHERTSEIGDTIIIEVVACILLPLLHRLLLNIPIVVVIVAAYGGTGSMVV